MTSACALGDAASGECFDGLQPDGPNRNRGAESVLAFQLANRAIRDASRPLRGFRPLRPQPP